MNEDAYLSESEALTQVIAALAKLSPDARERLLGAVHVFFAVKAGASPIEPRTPSPPTEAGTATNLIPKFSEDRSISPKLFLLEKRPETDVEKVACLAYYLTHYRDQPHFKTLDLSKLNTEAAQVKFSNAAWATNNALKMGYLTNASKGTKQLSAFGEQFVQALPDREAARDAFARGRPRRKSRRPNERASPEDIEGDNGDH